MTDKIKLYLHPDEPQPSPYPARVAPQRRPHAEPMTHPGDPRKIGVREGIRIHEVHMASHRLPHFMHDPGRVHCGRDVEHRLEHPRRRNGEQALLACYGLEFRAGIDPYADVEKRRVLRSDGGLCEAQRFPYRFPGLSRPPKHENPQARQLVASDYVRRSMDLPCGETFFETAENGVGCALDRESDPHEPHPFHGREQFMIEDSRVQLKALEARPWPHPYEGLAYGHRVVVGGVEDIVDELDVTKA